MHMNFVYEIKKKKLCLETILFIQNTNGNILSIFLFMPKQVLLVFHQTIRHFWYSGNQNTLTVLNCLLVSQTLLEIFLRFVFACYIWKWWADLRLLPIVIHFYWIFHKCEWFFQLKDFPETEIIILFVVKEDNT